MAKKIIALILCAVFTIFLSACSNDKNNKDNLVVAKVNGEAIYYSEYQKSLSDFLYETYNTIESRMDDSFGEENANAIRENVVDELINKKLLKKQAQELNLTKFSAEQKSTIEKNRDDFLANLKEQCVSEVKTDNEEKGITMSQDELDAAVSAKYNKYVDNKGYTQEYLYNYYWDELTLNVLKDYVFGDVAITDSDVREYYDKELTNQENVVKESNITALQNYFSNTYEINLYVPEGISYVKHIYIALPDDVLSKTSSSNTDETKALLKEELAKIKPKAEEALNLLKQGKDFDEVIAGYGDDQDMLKDDIKNNGYEICLGASDRPVELQIAANKLQEDGAISSLVETSSGYYIVKLLGKATAGAIDFEAICDNIKTLIENNKKTELWDQNLKKLKDDAKIEKYSKNYIPPTLEELMK